MPLLLTCSSTRFLQRESKCSSHTVCAAYIDGLLMGFNNVFYNGKPETCAAILACRRTIGLLEGIEDHALLLWGYPDSGIGRKGG